MGREGSLPRGKKRRENALTGEVLADSRDLRSDSFIDQMVESSPTLQKKVSGTSFSAPSKPSAGPTVTIDRSARSRHVGLHIPYSETKRKTESFQEVLRRRRKTHQGAEVF